MFERYTEKARRVIFFARYEASQFGDTEIGDVHLLLGLLRESKETFQRLLTGPGGALTFTELHAKVDELRGKIEAAVGPPRSGVFASVEMPLSNTAKRILAYAAEEAEMLGHRHIGSEHLLLGILHEPGCLAASLLKKEGIELERTREAIAAATPVEPEAGFTGLPPGFTGGMASGQAGVVAGSRTRGPRAGILEFVCEGKVVASVVVLVVTPVPRVGERVVFKDKDGADVAYRVEELTYKYERYPPDMAVAPHQLAKLSIRLKRE